MGRKTKQNPDTIDIRDFMRKMSATMAEAGLRIISDDHCCRLLAITYVFGGGNEAFTHNLKLLRHIFYAQKHCNVEGGNIVAAEHVVLIQKYTKELIKDIIKFDKKRKSLTKSDKEIELESWSVEFMKKHYGVEMFAESAILLNKADVENFKNI